MSGVGSLVGDRAVVAAPMAGGPSTWQLAAAVTRAGGIGFLAAGMRPVDRLVQDVASTRGALEGTEHAVFGVNLFVPEPANTAVPGDRRAPGSPARRRRAESVRRYRSGLLAEARRLGVELPGPEVLDPDAMDGWEAKLEAAEAGAWPLVTFTFGLPAASVFDRLHAAGSVLGVTVTSAAEAVRALDHGADVLCVQGPEAGGHRSVHDPAATPGTTPLMTLLAEVRAAVGTGTARDVPLWAAGGIMDAAGVGGVLDAGATAAQCGTAFLLAQEAGTSPLQRTALERTASGTGFAHPDGSARTALTRAYSGRWARGLDNRFMREHADAPAAYPEVNVLTGPLRQAATAAGDAESVSLWAGVGAAAVRAAPAAEIVRHLTP
ncbi:nitronate monooxygenase family protein [Citricoccus sp.]|uniref:NAD(P)H-dependent flavin oxidoreductase n=1 Tax=Citricoccus sp. TaxID=1978372 RepID=UPI002616CFB4|nr:nitronate monooxygenase [Citricoccus sp.]HRO28857.1 nitronate monooxygenase [Citricoccus sp.]HRO92299.1 nitronate monooxygenase [Citricoccus sp.]